MKFNSPQLGFNNNVRHKGRVFHIQTEDSGAKHPHIITHLFADGGRILKSTKTSYAEFLEEAELAKKVKSLMQDQHKAMFIALRAGKFDHQIGDIPIEAGHGPIEAGHGKAAEEEKPAATVRDASLDAATSVAAGTAPAAPAGDAGPSAFKGEPMRLPTIPSSLDLEAAAAQGLAIAAAAKAKQAALEAEAENAAGPPTEAAPGPAAEAAPGPSSGPIVPSPPAPAVSIPQPTASGSGALGPPSSKPGTSASALSRFAEKQGPPPAHAAPFRNVFSGRTSSADLSAAAAQARGAAPTAAPSSPRSDDLGARRPPTHTKLEPPRSRGPAPSVPPPARPPAEPPRARPPTSPGPLNPASRPSTRPPMTASLDLDIATLERASEQSQAPVYQQVRDLPPPPAAFTKPALGNTSYRSVTPQAAQIVSGRPPSGPAPRSPTGPRTPEARPAGRASTGPRSPEPRPAESAGRYAPSRPASIFGNARPQEGSSIFGEDLISEKSLDEVILSYLAEDLEGPAKK